MVKAWRETVTIPTYECGAPEKNPIFLDNRVYQGSCGKVYPYAVVEKVADVKTDKEWKAVWLENEYLKVMILPELGGRIQRAYDKVKQRDFVYYNHVIKPALVGLAGPWISGGIEFNWPQHHRPSTYMEVDCDIEENTDGSVTVWVNEMERMFHQKGMAGFTLRPGCAYLEIKGRAINRTPIPQTFLWWANPAVEVNDFYQSVFPQDVNAVFDHGKRAVSSFPIATGTYYKMDYSGGVDISNYKNIKVPTSYMAVNSKYNFVGGYENDTQGGMLHVASHHVSPGKKQWTWGNGDFGRTWDRALTDDNYAEKPGVFRPYIELMAGVFTENQPDFSWLMPYEEKRFTQYFMPYRDLGIVKNASKDIIFNLRDGKVQLLATSRIEVNIRVRTDEGNVLLDETQTLSPEAVWEKAVDAPADRLTVEVFLTDRFHTLLLDWHAESNDIRPIPDSAEAALRPEEIKTCEQLYLTGLHLEQYRHATFRPTDYYKEALRRDPDDVQNLNALGLWNLRNGDFIGAEPLLRKAVKVLMKRNPNPYNGEPLYNLALTLKLRGKVHEAYELFHKATWNAGWAAAAFFKAAEISTLEGRYYDALEEVENALIHNSHNHKARALKATLLRILDRKEEMQAWIAESLKIDRFNYGCLYESGERERWTALMHGSAANYEELMLDYADAGLWQDAVNIVHIAEEENSASPMIYYYQAWVEHQAGIDNRETLRKAQTADSYCCFPNRLESILALEYASLADMDDAKSLYYLGCLLYDKRDYSGGTKYWEISSKRDPSFPTVWRNLALGTFNYIGQKEKAVEYMEKAFSLDESDARVFMELDQLYKRMQYPAADRLARLTAHMDLVEQRDDLVLEYATLLNDTKQYEKAIEVIAGHQFHVWEGGEGKVSGQYQRARMELAKLCIARGENERAVSLLTECLSFPANLGEGKLYGAQDNDFWYWMGIAYAQTGDTGKARECWTKGTEGPTEPAPALYYNDAKADKIFYAGLCWQKLGETDKANGLFYKLINYGKNHLFDEVRMDYFAVSLPDLLVWNDSLTNKNRLHCYYLLALGHYGLGNREKAAEYLSEAEKLDCNHSGLQSLRTLIK